jgi:hypothetical protein
MQSLLRNGYDEHFLCSAMTESYINPILGTYSLSLSLKDTYQEPLHFILIPNISQNKQNPFTYTLWFDLKGSTAGRQTLQNPESLLEIQNLTRNFPSLEKEKTLKDKDFIKSFQRLEIPFHTGKKIVEQLRRDAEFLCEQNLIDYSLLLKMGICPFHEIRIWNGAHWVTRSNRQVEPSKGEIGEREREGGREYEMNVLIMKEIQEKFGGEDSEYFILWEEGAHMQNIYHICDPNDIAQLAKINNVKHVNKIIVHKSNWFQESDSIEEIKYVNQEQSDFNSQDSQQINHQINANNNNKIVSYFYKDDNFHIINFENAHFRFFNEDRASAYNSCSFTKRHNHIVEEDFEEKVISFILNLIYSETSSCPVNY